MKSKLLKEKFRKNYLVKPLYRKVKPKNVLVSVLSTYNQDGDAFRVKREIVDVGKGAKINQNTIKEYYNLPGTCARGSKTVINKVYKIRNNELVGFKMEIGNAGNSKHNDNNGKEKLDKLVQAEKPAVTLNVTDTWLRVYPLPQLEHESVCSTVFRCIACQFGLASALVLWTVLWLFVIHSFEGPYELKVTRDFEREENQLVIDLATELRHITPLSPKWREAIESRIQEGKQLTILAVGRGARAHPGLFWDLPGTFLFTVYVMTALGFGAPVPQTLWGRSAALIYAFIAIPTHIYLETPNYSRNSDVLKILKCGNIRKKIKRCLSVLSACHCVPVAAILYFACGSIAFGVLRGRSGGETFMFYLEFTTTGGLEHVRSHVRILYGFYVEGAMALLSYALATLRRRSNATVSSVADTYRLYQGDV